MPDAMPPLERMKCGVCGKPSVRFSVIGARCLKHIDITKGDFFKNPAYQDADNIIVAVDLSGQDSDEC